MVEFAFDPDRTVLGTVFTSAGEGEFALSDTDRARHMLVIGKTGQGKSTLLRNVAVQDIHTGRGVGIIDPHGDLSRELLDDIPSFRARDLVWIDLNDEERVVTFNLLENVPRERIAATASNIVAAFRAVWADSWGPRMERILYAAIAALTEAPNTSLLGLPRLLTDDDYRAHVLTDVTDPIVHGFFANEYAVWDEDYRTVAIDPVLNKVEQLLSSPAVRAMLGSTKSSIDFGDIMDGRKVLIANLAKGALGEGHAHLLGAMLVSGFYHAAMARGGNTGTRVPFSLIVDEWQNFASDSFAHILSEARKMKLSLVLANQFMAQASERLRAAVLGNVATIVAFQLSADDADTIAAEIGLKRGDMLTQLSVGEVWAKHATYGGPYYPRLIAPIVTNAKGCEAALKQNRLRNTFPRSRVEEKIARFFASAARGRAR